MGGQQGCCGNIDGPLTLMQTTTVLCPSIPAHIRVPADIGGGPVDFFHFHFHATLRRCYRSQGVHSHPMTHATSDGCFLAVAVFIWLGVSLLAPFGHWAG